MLTLVSKIISSHVLAFPYIISILFPLATPITTTDTSTVREWIPTSSNTNSNITNDALATSQLAFVVGGSKTPIPSSEYVTTLDDLFLHTLGFHGTAEGIFTPESLYPETGIQSLTLHDSMQEGQEILLQRITHLYESHEFSIEHPLTVLAWSQSAIMVSNIMATLHTDGIPTEALRFVLLGDVVAPNGGFLPRFGIPLDGYYPTVPALGLKFDSPTPNIFYPTWVYTDEYDLFADFPRYTLNLLSDWNAFLGIEQHARYITLTPQQVADAIPLANSDPDGLVHYFEIPTQNLPLLDFLQALPLIGQPLYDLLEPDTRILVDLGYGSLSQGWDPNPANEWSPIAPIPPNINLLKLLIALWEGCEQGVVDMLNQLDHPHLETILDNPNIKMLVSLIHHLGFTSAITPQQFLANPKTFFRDIGDVLHTTDHYPIDDISLWNATPDQVINDLTATFSANISIGLPIADTLVSLGITVPEVLTSMAVQELSDGHIVDSIVDPIAAGDALIPFCVFYGIGEPVLDAIMGTALNFIDLSGIVDV